MLTRTVHLYRNAFGGLTRDMWLLSLVTFINRAGTMVIPFMTIYLTQELGFSLQRAGIVMSCFGAGSILGTIAGGKLSDRYGYYPVMFWSLLLTGFMFLLLMHMHSFSAICITVFILSVIGDAFRPANNSSVAAYSVSETRTRSISLLRLAVNLGFSIGPAIGGFLAHKLGYDWLFMADGFTCIGAALFFRVMLKPKAAGDNKPVSKAAAREPVSSPYRDLPYLFFGLMITLWAIAFMQFFSVIPVFFKEQFLLNEGRIGALLALNGLIIALFEMPFIYSIEGRFRQLGLIRWGVVAVGVSYLIYVIPGAWIVIPVCSVIVITLGEMLAMPFASTYAMNRSTDQNRGQYMAVYSLTYSVAHVLAPMIGMYVAGRHGYDALWVLMAGFCTVSYAGLVMLSRAEARPLIQASKSAPVDEEMELVEENSR